MKKIRIILIVLAALFATGCAEENKPTNIIRDDVLVSSFYYMGCSDDFDSTGTIWLGKNQSVSGTYPNVIIHNLSCNSDTRITIDFYDNGFNGHYKFFLINEQNPSYSNIIYSGTTASYRFSFNHDMLYERGTYFGIARVTALNLVTREYYYYDFDIRAFDNSINSKEEAAVSIYEVRTAPKLKVSSEK